MVAASNCDLERLVSAKQFRSDLYFRLNVLRLVLPPLRDRRSDIPLLAQHFLQQFTEAGDRAVDLLSPASLQKLQTYDWPGNVRELLNVLQRAVVLADGSPILPEHILLTTTNSPPAQEPSLAGFRAARSQVIENFERQYIGELLQKHHGNITHAARDAAQDRRGFGRLTRNITSPCDRDRKRAIPARFRDIHARRLSAVTPCVSTRRAGEAGLCHGGSRAPWFPCSSSQPLFLLFCTISRDGNLTADK